MQWLHNEFLDTNLPNQTPFFQAPSLLPPQYFETKFCGWYNDT